MVVGEFGNGTMNLTRDNTRVTGILNVTHPLLCFSKVFGFDIESDGSVGTLAVPGVIPWNDNETCMTSNDREVEPTQSEFLLTLIYFRFLIITSCSL